MRGHEGTRDVSLEPHVALLASRQSRGWSRRRAAVEVKRAAARQGVSMPEPESIEKSISDMRRAMCGQTPSMFGSIARSTA